MSDRSVQSSVVPALDPSRSSPQLNAATRLALALAHARMTKRRQPACARKLSAETTRALFNLVSRKPC